MFGESGLPYFEVFPEIVLVVHPAGHPVLLRLQLLSNDLDFGLFRVLIGALVETRALMHI